MGYAVRDWRGGYRYELMLRFKQIWCVNFVAILAILVVCTFCINPAMAASSDAATGHGIEKDLVGFYFAVVVSILIASLAFTTILLLTARSLLDKLLAHVAASNEKANHASSHKSNDG